MEQSANWTLEEVPTLRIQTADVLREAILADVFRPGEKLVERTLADRTGVSRTSIREALQLLEAEGLVTRVPGRGVFVTQLSASAAAEIYEARAVLESAMARLFVERASDADIDVLRDLIAQAEATSQPELARVHAEKLDRIADAITRGAGNEMMRQMASVLRTRITYLRTITARAASRERRVETMALLNGILDALALRDADQAESLMRAYVERSARYALSIIGVADGADASRDTNEGTP